MSLGKWIKKILPDDHPLKNEEKLERDRRRVNMSIVAYKDLGKEIKDLVEADGFANHLKYERKAAK